MDGDVYGVEDERLKTIDFMDGGVSRVNAYLEPTEAPNPIAVEEFFSQAGD